MWKTEWEVQGATILRIVGGGQQLTWSTKSVGSQVESKKNWKTKKNKE